MRSLGVPLVATIHHPIPIDTRADIAQEPRTLKKLRQLILYPPFMQGIVARRLDMVITDSESSAREIAGEFRVPGSKMRIAYPGVDTEHFRRTDGHRSPDGGPHRLIVVGRTSDRKKGILYLLRALRLLKGDGVPLSLTVVDEVELNDTYGLDLVRRYGLEHMVHFSGRLTPDQLVHQYCSSDIAVTASVYEGFGLPAAEAMACEVPVIATRAGALTEVVADGESGILVPPRDPDALAAAIKRLIADEPLRQRLAAAGRQRVERLFTWEGCARRCAEVYTEALSLYNGR